MFGKKDKETTPESLTGKSAETSDRGDTTDHEAGNAPPLKPFSKKGSHAPAKPPSASGGIPEFQRRPPDIPGSPGRRLDRPRTGESESRRLIVGSDIQLNGEITACDKLVVEGHVQVNLPGARVLEISPSGLFKGTAEVDEADISGRFDGDLIARERLIVRTGGRVRGTVRYGKIVIESGGEIAGDMQTLEPSSSDEDNTETESS